MDLIYLIIAVILLAPLGVMWVGIKPYLDRSPDSFRRLRRLKNRLRRKK